MNKKIVVIGAGLGGLLCGYTLAKKGFQVCVLEQGVQIGGCMQTFTRGGVRFDTGFHYVGGLEPGQSLYPYFKEAGLLDLPWHKLDTACYDKVIIGDQEFSFANGYEPFVETLAERFPHQREALQQYVAQLHEVGESLQGPQGGTQVAAAGRSAGWIGNRKKFTPGETAVREWFAQSAYRRLCDTISDPLLRQVLSGTSLKMDLDAVHLPWYVFAQINHSYLESAWRLPGGGSALAQHLASGIEAMGGTVRTRARVTHLQTQGGKVTAVEINARELIHPHQVISSIAPTTTLALMEDCRNVRRVFRNRLAQLPLSYGFFTAQLRLKPGRVPYQNRNIYVYPADIDLWNETGKPAQRRLMVSFQVPQEGTYATQLDVLCPLLWAEMEPWANASFPRKLAGSYESYEAYKEALWARCWAQVAPHVEGLTPNAVEAVYMSTPLTYRDFTGSPQGTAFGIKKDCLNVMGTLVAPRTPLENLWLTGQHLNVHGVLGVAVTAQLTCNCILER